MWLEGQLGWLFYLWCVFGEKQNSVEGIPVFPPCGQIGKAMKGISPFHAVFHEVCRLLYPKLRLDRHFMNLNGSIFNETHQKEKTKMTKMNEYKKMITGCDSRSIHPWGI